MRLRISYLLDSTLRLLVGDPAVPYKTGTGFLYVYSDVNNVIPDQDEDPDVYVVTSKHLFDNFPTDAITTIGVNFASGSIAGKLQGTFKVGDWSRSSTADVAVLPVPFSDLKAHGALADLVLTSSSVVTRRNAYAVGAYEGARVLIVGFPIGWRPSQQDFSITRDGVIGEIRGWMSSEHDTILVSGAIYPGNSGSPVVLESGDADPSDSSGLQYRLVGMAISRAMSPLHENPAMSENADIAHVLPMDVVDDLIRSVNQQQFPLSTLPDSSEGEEPSPPDDAGD